MQMQLAFPTGVIEVRDGVWECSSEELSRLLDECQAGVDMQTLNNLIKAGGEVVSFEPYADHVPGRVY